MNERQKPSSSEPTGNDKIQGEGDYAADRRYRQRTDGFLKSADADGLAHEAAPRTAAEVDEMAKAEQEGKAHAHVPERRETGNDERSG